MVRPVRARSGGPHACPRMDAWLVTLNQVPRVVQIVHPAHKLELHHITDMT